MFSKQKYQFQNESESKFLGTLKKVQDNAKYALVTAPAVISTSAFANTGLPELTIDTAGLLKVIAVVIAAVAVVGMGTLTVVLTAKAFKYIRTAL